MIRHQGLTTITLAFFLALSGAGLLSFSAPRLLGFNPPKVQPCDVHCPAGIPKVPVDKPVRVMTWNVQFLAGTYYPYWAEDSSKFLKESDIESNLDRIIEVIKNANPDILQLQEVHFTHPVTFHKNQLEMLYRKLADKLPCYSSASYWKSTFIPQKHLTGTIDMRLVTMSRYQIDDATQILLPATRKKRVLVPFYPRHSLLEIRMPLENGKNLYAINTHLDAPGIGRGNMYEQVDAVYEHLELLTKSRKHWLLSGDLNLIPPGFHGHLPENQKEHYLEHSLLAPFYKSFRGVPALDDLSGSEWPQWLTAYDLNQDRLDLIIDYIFRPEYIGATNSQVLHLPLDISDHMPVITELLLSQEL
ncbi:endonuclease/exonuclease/phosphatase family protein [Sansalvadorimonas sp. 2012CJ34-2]|uniref:Endonuclease/exonuclease/phosphatase family protein n=1 Tax=Parendozoicomonas callyspongiae TaxID=2942213 RepID=A0ABT0PDI4_9GAMM|nr:endonuclease/exonuclease/phosphatase family protein [Sansalvadorimonas sp. 2012CJ34-2]MCL6269281.1 endonuclease/exonuclease/phosphatase family protein [Sansalvadorimonas sp. 2012CJ34-2]